MSGGVERDGTMKKGEKDRQEAGKERKTERKGGKEGRKW